MKTRTLVLSPRAAITEETGTLMSKTSNLVRKVLEPVEFSGGMRNAYCTVLLDRCGGSLAAMRLLSEVGLASQVKALFRQLLEASFRLAALVRNPSAIMWIEAQDLIDKENTLNDLMRLSACEEAVVYGRPSEELAAGIRETIRNRKKVFRERYGQEAKAVSDWRWAQAGDRAKDFWAYYCLLSQDVHHSASSIESHFEVGEDARLVLVGSSKRDLEANALEATMVALRAVEDYFKLSDEACPRIVGTLFDRAQKRFATLNEKQTCDA